MEKTDREFLEGLGIEGENIDLILEKSNFEISREKLIHTTKNEFTKRGVKNIDAAMKLFDFEGLSEETDDVNQKIDEFVSKNDYLFEQNIKKPMFSGAVNNENEPTVTKEEFSKMGYLERLKIFNKSPEEYKQLTE